MWQDQVRSALVERDVKEKAQAHVAAQYRRLVNLTLSLKERNGALLSAGGPRTMSKGAVDDVGRASSLASLEAQLVQTRLELSEQYKIQSSNAQRLLALTDTLREGEERGNEEREELRRLRSEVEGLRERARWHKEVVTEKERQLLVSHAALRAPRTPLASTDDGPSLPLRLQILQDDHASLDLELSQVTIQNENLKIDNSSLLQRWIESKNDEAAKMNEANTWVTEAAKVKSVSQKLGALEGNKS